MKIKYRLFVQDVGEKGFSGYTDVYTADPGPAITNARRCTGVDVIALPHSMKDLWPEDRTGRLSVEALVWLDSNNQRLPENPTCPSDEN